MTLTLLINDKPAEIGAVYEDFRGDKVKLLRIIPPHKPSSTGRIYVEHVKDGFKSEYFPSVIGGVWHGRTDQD